MSAQNLPTEEEQRAKLIADIEATRAKLQAFVDIGNEHARGISYLSGFFQAVTLISGIMAYRGSGQLVWAVFAAFAGASALTRLVKVVMLSARLRKGPAL